MISYHFHATMQVAIGNIQHFDGVVQLQKPVITNDDYKAARKEIYKTINLPEVQGDKLLSVDSFSLIHKPKGIFK